MSRSAPLDVEAPQLLIGALVRAGLRGRADIAVTAGDVLDPHAMAMVMAAGATVVEPWLALELARELAGSRGALANMACASC